VHLLYFLDKISFYLRFYLQCIFLLPISYFRHFAYYFINNWVFVIFINFYLGWQTRKYCAKR